MNVEAYVMCFNEEDTLPLTLSYYNSFCSKVVLLDNFSTDKSREIALLDFGCEVRLFGRQGVLDDREYTKLKNNVWKGSQADFVIIVDADEILWHSDITTQLIEAKRLGFSILETYGWQVFSNDVPRESWLEITTGFHDPNYSKLCIFDPKKVKEINYVHGCHVAKPVYDGCIMKPNLTLFHYRNVGGVHRLIERHALYRERLSDWNKRFNAGHHYTYDDDRRKKEWEEQLKKSVEFSLLGG